METIKQLLREAELVLIGGGAGLSAAAGLVYSGRRFAENFAPFIQKYHLSDMYSAGFYPFDTEEEKWAYWAKHILLNRYGAPAPLYRQLYQLVQDKNYFVITTNVDAQFQKSGFSPNRIFAVQGDYGLLQCATGCHDTLYENETLVKQMVAQTDDCAIPTHLVPVCPVCGGRMDVHIRRDAYFVQNRAWYLANDHFARFVAGLEGKKAVLLELGVGFHTPVIIRYPFEQIAEQNQQAVLVRVNKEPAAGSKHTRYVQQDIAEVIQALCAGQRY